MGIKRIEQETILNFSAEENVVTLYTSDPVWMRRMDKRVKNNPQEFTQTGSWTMDGEVVSKTYQFPVKLLSIRSKTKEKRELSEEERKRIAERLRPTWNRRKGSDQDE